MKRFTNLITGRALLIVVLGVLIVFPSGCSKKQPEDTKIKIGAVLCLTGSGAPYGEDALRGIQTAIYEINRTGGINGADINLIVEDDQTQPTLAASATSKLINQNKVQVIIGAVTSSSMLAAAPIAEKLKVVMISPGASNPEITKAGDYIFRNWISDEIEGKAMANYLYHDEKVEKVAVLYINNDYGLGLKEVFAHAFEELGGVLTAIEYYNQDDTDFRTQITKIMGSKPERIYLAGYYKEMALILKQGKELGNDTPFRSVVCFEDPELLKAAGAEAEGVIYSSPFYNPDSKEEYVVRFVNLFKKQFNREPGIFAAHGYDAMMIIASILNKTEYSGMKIKENLYGVQNYPGVSGLTSFDQNGDVVKPIAIKHVKNQQFLTLKVLKLH